MLLFKVIIKIFNYLLFSELLEYIGPMPMASYFQTRVIN